MANPKPTMTKEFFENQIKPVGGEIPGDVPLDYTRGINVRFPKDVADYLFDLPREERIPLIRNLVIREVRERIKNESK